MRRTCIGIVLLLAVVAASAADSAPAQLNNIQRDRVRNMLREAVNAVKKNYYDQSLHGIDLDARAKIADQKIQEATSYGAAFGQVAWTLDVLDDSHTTFHPPARPYRMDNGWSVQVVGERCLFTAVRPDSDAAAQGIKPGDELLVLDGFRTTPEILHKLLYILNALAPHSAHEMVVVSPGEQPRKVTAKVTYARMPNKLENSNDWMDMFRNAERNEKLYEPRMVEMGDLMIYKLPEFFISDGQIDELFGKAEKHKTLILDLRDNPGGAEEVLTKMLGHLFDHEVKVGDRVGRKDKKPVIAKVRGHRFTGKLIVLVDGGSASCSELFARVVQLEKRGVVIGDRSSGHVRESLVYSRTEGIDTVVPYAVQVSVSDLVMADEKSLEHNPVVPDEVVLPTPGDLRMGRDPVLSHVVELAGGKLTPEQAGGMFPFLWKKI